MCHLNDKIFYLVRFIFFIFIVMELIWALEFNKIKKVDSNIPVLVIIIISIGFCTVSYYKKNKTMYGIFLSLYIIMVVYYFLLFCIKKIIF